VYRSPSESLKIFESKFADMMNTLKMKLPSSTKIIGDFNVDIMNNGGKKNSFLNLNMKVFLYKYLEIVVPQIIILN